MFIRRGKRLPSDRLPGLLHDQGLDQYAQWSDCEAIVRDLARDLPDFDSVWLDALVQRQLLTPWQASQLQLETPPRLVIGGRQLREPLGSSTFLALDSRSRSLQVLRRLMASADRAAGMLEAVQRSGLRPPRSVVLPKVVETEPSSTAAADAVWLATTFVPGWDFSELLVRGGRLPWEVVAEVGRELLQGLAWLESAGVLHGEVVLRNLRLTPAGRVVLVDAFSRRLSQQRPTMGQPPSLRHSEGVAPELPGSARPADVRSEMHAAGCLLWQLLTARAPVVAADPVRRMLYLRDNDVPDVRGLVPDCPEWMARYLVSMTRRLPELRPARMSELSQVWNAQAPTGFGGLRRVVRELPDRRMRQAMASPPRVRRPAKSRRGRWLLATSLLAAAAALPFLRPDLLTLALPQTRPPDVVTAAATPAVTAELQALRKRSLEPKRLPAPDESGVVRLATGQVWLADTVRVRGPLRIEAEGPGCAVILVPTDQPWILQAETLELRGIQIQQGRPRQAANPATGNSTQLTAVQCQELTIEDCVVQSPSAADEFSGISWYAPPGNQGRITIRRSVFAGGGYGFAMNQPPQALQLENVLLACRGGGMLCEIADPRHTAWTAGLKHVTQRFGFSVVDFVVHDGAAPGSGPQQLEAELVCDEAAFEPRMAIIRVRPGEAWTSASIRVRISGPEGSSGLPAVVPPETEPAVYIDSSLGKPAALPESQFADLQLLYADLQFAAEGTGVWAAAELVDLEGPRLSESLPGCRVRDLPAGTQ
ncbi:MAG: serine/threonine protein kinase [Planctomycetaceae bacterium]